MHFREFRNRSAIAVLAIIIASVAGFLVSDLIVTAASAPLHDTGTGLASINFTTLSGAFDLRLRIAMTVGVVLASPVWLFQIWRFLVPGMTKREKRYGALFVVTAVPLFVTGAGFGWWVMPHIVALMASFAPAGATSLFSANEYFDFLLRLVVAVGFGFASPVALVVINAFGLISGMTLLRGWRLAIVIVVIFAAVVTPPSDMLSLAIIAIPLILLYFGACVICVLHDRRVARAASRRPALGPA